MTSTPLSPSPAARAPRTVRPSRRTVLGGVATSTALATVGTPVAMGAGHAPSPRTGPGTRSGPGSRALPPPDSGALRAAIDDLEHPRATGAQLRVSGSAGRWYGTSGVADLRTGRPVGLNDKVRAGSVTKAFVATVALQLADEGRLRLESPVRHYLPGLLPPGFEALTVAHLLGHTSGLPDHVGLPELDTPEAVLRHRFDRWTPQQLVATATRRPLKFTPGTRQEYRGINYVLAALVIEQVTGRPYGEEVTARVLRPLRLGDTSFPGADRRIHGRHMHGYLDMTDGSREDVTEFDMSGAWAEGELVSTTGDLHRFLAALFSGALLPERQLRRMFTLPPAHVRMLDGSPARYSTGLQTATVDGVTFWGKTGEQYGYATGMFATRDQQRRLVWSFGPTQHGADPSPMSRRIVKAATSRHVVR
ncbi:serine hydrolase domain-containing protein [Streptomyces iconiensis]|uniref:Serine hydrolase domain-containing protein n=1 Tax=Streptomyces iconiensis TaxID=1384038 RepID=A0ABT7A1V2_9ACTN|nr:serine hydrolase domain-containing protein [Streptomyces iconiensis]MDJ1135286.1 serine hydrolase domain-containing protein [Streptomyces iconiensis]